MGATLSYTIGGEAHSTTVTPDYIYIKPMPEMVLDYFLPHNPGASGIARWIKTSTLSGRFEEFTAEFSHSDELGGELTSLIDQVNTHVLIRDVLVDLPGRDAIRDFLAKDGDVYRVYESESQTTQVADQSSSSSSQLLDQTGSKDSYTLSVPVTAGFLYVQLQDPTGGEKILKHVLRSDGKIIKSDNAWLSMTRHRSDPWEHFLNLFDVNTTVSYTVAFADPSSVPQPPVLQFIPDRSGAESRQLDGSHLQKCLTERRGDYPCIDQWVLLHHQHLWAVGNLLVLQQQETGPGSANVARRRPDIHSKYRCQRKLQFQRYSGRHIQVESHQIRPGRQRHHRHGCVIRASGCGGADHPQQSEFTTSQAGG